MAGQKCPECGRRFRVLDDEVGMHECPGCGYDGQDQQALLDRLIAEEEMRVEAGQARWARTGNPR
jgi:Zn ribbon nucleic-acid-binding protein